MLCAPAPVGAPAREGSHANGVRMGASNRVGEWLDRFFDCYYDRHPVHATFIGVEGHDQALPDVSQTGLHETLFRLRSLRETAPSPPISEAPAHERIDLELARGYLDVRIRELESTHFERGNPALHTGEAVFGVMSLFLNAAGENVERMAAARARMERIPAFLRAAREAVPTAPAAWTERAIRECDGAVAFFGRGVHALPGWDSANAPLGKSAEVAARAFEDHQAHLREMRGRGADAGIGCGSADLELILRKTHVLDRGAAEIDAYASEQLAEAEDHLAAHAHEFGGETAGEVLTALEDDRPTTEGYLDRYQTIWDEAHDACVSQDLLTWPEFPIRYVPRPAWAREAAPYLYFLFYRSPRAFRRPEVHEYLVTPIEPGMPADEQARLLRANNDSVIRRNHVIHHGGVGHHVQNWHAHRAPSRVARIAAVDCASRIAMGCGGTMAEGWACYATDLMGEVGLLSPLERYAEVQGRARMCARAIVDVRLHGGAFTLDDAASFYVRRAGMTESAARREAVKNSMFPGGALMYLMGRDAIHDLRREVRHALGDAYRPREFHDAFLSWGSLPVGVVAREMRSALRDGRDLGAWGGGARATMGGAQGNGRVERAGRAEGTGP